MEQLKFDPIALPQEALEASEDITLRDLLESPSCQAWILSALGNHSRFRTYFSGGDTPFEEHLQFKLHQMSARIPYAAKNKLYATTGKIIAEARRIQRGEA